MNETIRPGTTLKQLSVFAAAARHLSFTRAARELGVLQPAVSRQVADLERSLDTRLFLRSKPLLTLTADGESLYLAVREGLENITRAVDQIRVRDRRQTVVVNASIGLTSCFLMSRLVAFEQAYPDFAVELVTRDQNDPYDTRSSDVIFVFDRPGDLGLERFRLFMEEMILVCGPGHADISEFPLEWVESLPHFILGSRAHRNDWSRFFALSGMEAGAPVVKKEYTSFMVYLQAISQDRGLGIGWRYLLDEPIESGRVRIAHPHSVPGDRGYFCYLTERASGNDAARAFFDWARTLGPPSGPQDSRPAACGSPYSSR